ncbi:Polyamine oxidase-like [Oopsacas minuta]|uniref:Amine oxidase n=1 Tax=Oopsacas minuta TaxID=111878 RepID=A0AAV7KBC0_9METZ|nr:Polyamine oxidase-like [Oopsacas minuta]
MGCLTNTMKLIMNFLIILLATLQAVSSLPECGELDAEVLILGAGMAGINAARTLFDEGMTDFLIIEAKPQIGGRIFHSEIRPGGAKVELGANWIQGVDPDDPEAHPLYELAQRCGGIQGNFSDFDSIIEYDSTGLQVSDLLDYDGIADAYENVEYISTARQADGQTDITVREALLQSNWTVDSNEDAFLDWFCFDFCFAEPPDNTSLFHSQPLSTYTDFGNASNTEDFLISDQSGYAKLVECIADGILGINNSRLLLETKVNIIKWSDDCVCVETYRDGVMKEYCASYAIITFSIGVLQSEEINMKFEPDLPEWKLDVINMFSMAHYLKMYAEFPTVFWDDVEFIGYVSDVRGYFPLFLSENLFLPDGNNVLQITTTGEIATRLLLQNENETINELVQVLRSIYGSNVTEPTAFIQSTWYTDPYFLGSYSNIPLGVTNQTFIDLAAPVGRVYFSGEATSMQYNGFVHGAYFAGRDSAEAVLESISIGVSVVANLLLVMFVVIFVLLF